MIKRLPCFICITVLLLLGFSFGPVLASSDVVYVDDSWTGPGDCGGHVWGTDAANTVQDGLALVEPNGTLYVNPGVYSEHVTVLADGVRVLGASGAVIDGGGTGHCVLVRADGVTIDGFELRNGYSGILADLGTSSSTFSHNLVHDNVNTAGNSGTGITLWGDCDGNTVSYNTIYGNDRQGIFIGFDPAEDPTKLSTGNRVENNVIHGNGLYTTGGLPDRSNYGLQLWYVTGGLVSGNEIYGQSQPALTDFQEVGIGLYLCQAAGVTVSGNNIHDNRIGVAMYDCGVPGGCAGNTITSNVITGCDLYGFRLYNDAETTTFRDNALSGNAVAIKNSDAERLAATGNWWGDPSGPYNLAANPAGEGNEVSDNVDFDPWYIDAALTQLSDTLVLSFNNSGGGHVDAAPPGLTYSYGDSVELTAVPATNWGFDRWQGGLYGSANPATITMDGNKTVSAVFLLQYALTLTVTGSGTVTRSPDLTEYTDGTSVALTAVPAPGWTFSHWTGDLTGSANPATITMNGNRTVTAVFLQQYALTLTVTGSGTVTRSPDLTEYTPGTEVTLRAVPAMGWTFSHWTGDLTGSANPTTLVMNGNKVATAVFGIVPPPPPPTGSLGPFKGESEDAVVKVDVPEGISENPILLTIRDASTPPPTDGNPNLGVYDIELKDAKTGEAITELTKAITITFHYTPAMLAAAGVTDPHDLVIFYWDQDAEPAACWVALPTVVDEAAGTISTTVDHLTTFTAMVDADFPKLGDIAGHWAQTDILRLASYGAVNGYADGTFRPETAVTRAQYAKFIVAALGIPKGTTLPAGFGDASEVQNWAVPYLAACLRDGIMTGADGLLRPNATITRVEAAAMVVRALGPAEGGGGTGGVLTFSDAASIPSWATAFVAAAVQHGLIAGLPGNVFDAGGTLTRAQAATILSHAVDVK